MPRQRTSKAQAKDKWESTANGAKQLPLAEPLQSTLFPESMETTKQPPELSLEELGAILEKVNVIEGWIKAMQGYALKQLLDGKDIPGWKLVEGRANRCWRFDDEAILKKLKAFAKMDELMPRSLISPAQAEKIVKGSKAKEMLVTLVEKPRGKVMMAPIDDPRPAFVRGEEFGQDVPEDFLEEI